MLLPLLLLPVLVLLPPARTYVRPSVRLSSRPSPLSFFGVGKSRQRLPVPPSVVGFVRVTGRWRAALSSSAVCRCLGGSVRTFLRVAPPGGGRGLVGGGVLAVVSEALPPGSSGEKLAVRR